MFKYKGAVSLELVLHHRPPRARPNLKSKLNMPTKLNKAVLGGEIFPKLGKRWKMILGPQEC